MKTITSTRVASELRNLVDQQLQNIDFCGKKPYNLYQPMEYILSLKAKRIRPVLTMLAYHAVTHQQPEGAINVALSVELFHNFTLMHDDIMDQAPLRRGNPSVHQTWNINTAILSGDALLVYAMGNLVKDFPDKAEALVNAFTEIAMDVCEGQMSDMDFETSPRVSINDYIEMIRKKTAVLIGGSLRLGAIAGDADPVICSKFQEFGEALGIAFQLKDDLMDAFPSQKFGKQTGGDIIANKKTYLMLKALELSDYSQRERLQFNMRRTQNPHQKVQEVLHIYNELEISKHTQELIGNYHAKALRLGQELAGLTSFTPIQLYLEEISQRTF